MGNNIVSTQIFVGEQKESRLQHNCMGDQQSLQFFIGSPSGFVSLPQNHLQKPYPSILGMTQPLKPFHLIVQVTNLRPQKLNL
jgi:hypothetical protein